jgi:hypothetical protein
LFTLSYALDLSQTLGLSPLQTKAVTPRIPWSCRRGGGGVSKLL